VTEDPGSNSSPQVQALWRIPKWFPKLSPDMQETLKKFHAELLNFNAKINLIGRGTERDADEAHFADAISGSELLLKHSKAETIYDIGSGNGLPGIAMAILDLHRKLILVEVDERKGEFLKQVIHRLGLKNVSVKIERFEKLPESSIEAAVSRGFASISRTLLMGNKQMAPKSSYYHMKTNNWSREIAEMPSQLCAIWSPELVGEYSLPDTQARRAVVVTKKL
jgi:16S rRNA (guanine527-N7)-methyltransferase